MHGIIVMYSFRSFVNYFVSLRFVLSSVPEGRSKLKSWAFSFQTSCHHTGKKQVILCDCLWEARQIVWSCESLPFLSRLPPFIMEHVNNNKKINFMLSMTVSFICKQNKLSNILNTYQSWNLSDQILYLMKRIVHLHLLLAPWKFCWAMSCDWQLCLLYCQIRRNNNKRTDHQSSGIANLRYQSLSLSVSTDFSETSKKPVWDTWFNFHLYREVLVKFSLRLVAVYSKPYISPHQREFPFKEKTQKPTRDKLL